VPECSYWCVLLDLKYETGQRWTLLNCLTILFFLYRVSLANLESPVHTAATAMLPLLRCPDSNDTLAFRWIAQNHSMIRLPCNQSRRMYGRSTISLHGSPGPLGNRAQGQQPQSSCNGPLSASRKSTFLQRGRGWHLVRDIRAIFDAARIWGICQRREGLVVRLCNVGVG
jgi:hypothetical protein